MKFTLSIELGNEAMQDSEDVAHALRTVAGKVAEYYAPLEGGERGSIRDLNGNTCGSWEVR